MKNKFIQAYMDVAYRFSQLSHAKRLKVGSIIVKNDRIISIGYNGMPAGWDNECETIEWSFDVRDTYHSDDWKYCEDKKKYYRLKTKPEVLHAEMNALMKLAKSTESGEDATIFITHSPCIDCAKGIYQAGIKRVFYSEQYRSEEGINFLKKGGIEVLKI